MLLLAVGLLGCDGGGGLDGVYAWPAYLPDRVTVTGECVVPDRMVGISSPAASLTDPGTDGVAVLIQPREEWHEIGDPDGFARYFAQDLPNGAATPLEIRETTGVGFIHQPAYSAKRAVSVAWEEAGQLILVTGFGLDLAEVRRVAESLEPAPSDRFPGCS